MGEIDRYVVLDFETRSSVDIGKCGLFKYIESPDFSPLLLAYAFDDEPVQLADFKQGDPFPEALIAALDNPEITLIAQNAAFERTVIHRVLGKYSAPERWFDVMHLSAHCGLPLSLKKAGEALGLGEDQAKMKEGKALIRYFCNPRKPTKSDPDRRWNDPQHAPEKWKLFRSYCIRDVEAERTIYRTLRRWTPDETERRFWALDQRINERGIRCDLTLARNASEIDRQYKAELAERAIAISGIENPNSVMQVKAWLMEQEGLDVPSLNKKEIADVVAKLQTDKAKEFMTIRSELSKTSVKKYDAFLRSACADDHVKGCFQFFGGHTGRFAGRLVQLQNLRQNHLEDLDLARTVAKEGDAAGFELLWPNVSGAISELVRTVLIPEEGQRFIVADFSAIEARVSAWLAGEEWVLQSFRDGKDIYCETASQMFKVPVEKHGQNSELRAKGKIAVLACIAEDEPVLTDRGLVPIQDVRITDRVWDGEEWVAHKGVIYKGEREVITYEGLTATPDHVVFTRDGGTILFGRAAACGAHLLQPGAGGKAVRTRRDHLRGTPMERVVESLLRADPLRGLRTGAVDRSRQSAQREKPGLSELLRAAAKLPKMAVQARHGSKDALHQPEPPELGELRRTRDHVRLPVPGSGVRLDRGEPRPASALGAAGAGPDRQRQGLRAGEHPLGDTGAEPRQPALHPYRGVAAGGLAVRLQRGAEEAPGGENARRDPGRCAGSRRGEAKKLARHKKVVRVYDIVDAGPRHRYTVSGVLVHNCGYGGGVGALKAFGADRMGMTPEEMTETIDRWRSSNPRIVAAWKSLERAMARCIVHKATTVDKVCGIRFRWDRGIVWMRLPSGREMAYYGAAYGPSRRSGREGNALSYMGIDQTSRKWVAIETFGGRVFENLVQATARDVLREAMFSLEAKGFDIRATVHDECICTEPIGGKTVEQMCEAMCPDVPWMAGLPLKAAGYEGAYYFKD